MTKRPALSRDFYDRPCLTVAKELLGKYLCRRLGRRVLCGRIVETEAYIHEEDRACHAWRGPTPRASALFGPPGRAYVYLIYGMHHCFNAVCEPAGTPAAVLVRALEPIAGIAGRTDGPGKLCAALAITREQNLSDLVARGPLWIEDRGGPTVRALATPRIGVDYAGKWALRPWRLVDPDSAWLSRKLPRVSP
ncbi:MAG: DNA-3-methyladenine glycosylase [Myxococcales bacterium]|nr:DNA-3-methyladenine glycosylase [Myxococcales bacterium]